MLIPFRIFNLEKLTDPTATRYALGAVAFTREGDQAAAMASDGCLAARVTWREDARDEHPLDCAKAEHAESTLIDAKTCRNLAKIKVRAPKAILHNAAMIQADDNSVSIGVFDGEHTTQNTVRLVEGRFPNMQQVIEGVKKPSRLSVVLDVKRTKTMLDTLDKVSGCGQFELTVAEADSGNHAVEFLASNSEDGTAFEGFVMPCNGGKKPSRRTADAAVPAEPAAAAELTAAREEIARLTADRDADRERFDRELADAKLNSQLDLVAAKKELLAKLEAAEQEIERLNSVRVSELNEYKADREKFKAQDLKLASALGAAERANGAMAGKLETVERQLAKSRAELVAAVEAAKAAKVTKPAEPAAPQSGAGFRIEGFRAGVGAGTGSQFLPAASVAASGWDAVYAYADGRVGAADIVVGAEGVSFRRR